MTFQKLLSGFYKQHAPRTYGGIKDAAVPLRRRQRPPPAGAGQDRPRSQTASANRPQGHFGRRRSDSSVLDAYTIPAAIWGSRTSYANSHIWQPEKCPKLPRDSSKI